MDKSSRLSLIRSRAAIICGASLPALLPVSRSEIRESVSSEVAGELVAIERSELREDDGEFSSSLSFDRIKSRAEEESAILLSHNERKQLAEEVLAHRIAITGQYSRFPLVLVA